MAIKQKQNGFALFAAIVFMSVMLAFGLTLSSLAYKQQTLALSSVASQYAFYAADSGMECALYYDQKLNDFRFPESQPTEAPIIECDGVSATFPSAYPDGIISYTSGSQWAITERFDFESGSCADVTVYKPAENSGGTTYIFSQGYDVPCADIGSSRAASRGLEARY